MKEEIKEKEEKVNKHKKITIEFSPTALWKITTLFLAVLLVISILTGGFGFGGGGGKSAQLQVPSIQQQGNNQPQPVIKAELKEDDDFCFGDANAKVTIFEFSDYQCPFCKRAFDQTFPELQKLAKEGKVRYCVKDYPLPFHEQADEASVAANCAGLQGKYWEMHDKLFQTQQDWSGNTGAIDLFKGYAKELGLDEKKFASCVADPKQAKEVQDDLAEGSAAGVSGTPTFYINGQQLVGAQPSSAFKQIIDAELSK